MSLTKNLVDNIKNKSSWLLLDLLKVVDGFDRHLNFQLAQQGKLEIFQPAKYITTGKISRGDIVRTDFSVGSISHHPGIIWKIKGDVCYCLTLSTKEAPYNLHKIESSRFLSHSYVSKTVVEMPMERASKGFIIPFDNKKELATIFRKAREYYSLLVK